MNSKMNCVLLLVVWGATAAAADPSANLAKPLEPLRPFLGKTWKGPFKSSTPEKPKYDIAKWERALNGQAVRILHSINDGEYGGETLGMWEPQTERAGVQYFTPPRFFTRGPLT